MDLRRQGQVIRSWLWLLIASLLLAGGAAYLVSSSLPKVYESTVTLLVGQSSSSSTPNYNDLLASQRISQTYADLATTGTILGQVMANAGLGITVDDFRQRVKADAPTNSTLVTVTVQDGEPARAAALANAIGDQLIAASDSVYGKNSQVQDFIAGQISATQVQIQDTQTQIDGLAALKIRTDAEAQQLQALRDRITSLRASYAALLALPGSGANAVTVVDPATPPLQPSSPRVLLNTLLAALVGLLLALGIAFTMEYLDDTVKSPEDVEAATGLATLGTVLKMKGEKGRSEIYRLATLLYPRGPAAEAYRTLRTNLEFASVDEPVKTLLVTSSIPSEGKTTTSGNLAVAFAQAGRTRDPPRRGPAQAGRPQALRPAERQRADLPPAERRRDHRRRRAGHGGGAPAGRRHGTTAAQPGRAAGVPPDADDPGAPRRPPRTSSIVDSPPLQAVADAAILASITDGTLLVIDAGRTRRAAAGRGREALAKSGARVLGAALNRLSQRARQRLRLLRLLRGVRGRGSRRRRARRPPRSRPERRHPPPPLPRRTRAADGRRAVAGGMRIVVHDYSGHPFQVQLSRELARRGHNVLHLHFAGFQTPKAALVRRSDDPPTFAVEAIDLDRPFAKYRLVRRLLQERQLGANPRETDPRLRPGRRDLVQRAARRPGGCIPRRALGGGRVHLLAAGRLLGRDRPPPPAKAARPRAPCRAPVHRPRAVAPSESQTASWPSPTTSDPASRNGTSSPNGWSRSRTGRRSTTSRPARRTTRGLVSTVSTTARSSSTPAPSA